MRMGEMSSSEFSESVDTRLDPQLSAVLEEMRLRTGFNTLYRTYLNNTASHTGPPPKRSGQIAAIIYSKCLDCVLFLSKAFKAWRSTCYASTRVRYQY